MNIDTGSQWTFILIDSYIENVYFTKLLIIWHMQAGKAQISLCMEAVSRAFAAHTFEERCDSVVEW